MILRRAIVVGLVAWLYAGAVASAATLHLSNPSDQVFVYQVDAGQASDSGWQDLEPGGKVDVPVPSSALPMLHFKSDRGRTAGDGLSNRADSWRKVIWQRNHFIVDDNDPHHRH